MLFRSQRQLGEAGSATLQQMEAYDRTDAGINALLAFSLSRAASPAAAETARTAAVAAVLFARPADPLAPLPSSSFTIPPMLLMLARRLRVRTPVATPPLPPPAQHQRLLPERVRNAGGAKTRLAPVLPVEVERTVQTASETIAAVAAAAAAAEAEAQQRRAHHGAGDANASGDAAESAAAAAARVPGPCEASLLASSPTWLTRLWATAPSSLSMPIRHRHGYHPVTLAVTADEREALAAATRIALAVSTLTESISRYGHGSQSQDYGAGAGGDHGDGAASLSALPSSTASSSGSSMMFQSASPPPWPTLPSRTLLKLVSSIYCADLMEEFTAVFRRLPLAVRVDQLASGARGGPTGGSLGTNTNKGGGGVDADDDGGDGLRMLMSRCMERPAVLGTEHTTETRVMQVNLPLGEPLAVALYAEGLQRDAPLAVTVDAETGLLQSTVAAVDTVKALVADAAQQQQQEQENDEEQTQFFHSKKPVVPLPRLPYYDIAARVVLNDARSQFTTLDAQYRANNAIACVWHASHPAPDRARANPRLFRGLLGGTYPPESEALLFGTSAAEQLHKQQSPQPLAFGLGSAAAHARAPGSVVLWDDRRRALERENAWGRLTGVFGYAIPQSQAKGERRAMWELETSVRVNIPMNRANAYSRSLGAAPGSIVTCELTGDSRLPATVGVRPNLKYPAPLVFSRRETTELSAHTSGQQLFESLVFRNLANAKAGARAGAEHETETGSAGAVGAPERNSGVASVPDRLMPYLLLHRNPARGAERLDRTPSYYYRPSTPTATETKGTAKAESGTVSSVSSDNGSGMSLAFWLSREMAAACDESAHVFYRTLAAQHSSPEGASTAAAQEAIRISNSKEFLERELKRFMNSLSNYFYIDESPRAAADARDSAGSDSVSGLQANLDSPVATLGELLAVLNGTAALTPAEEAADAVARAAQLDPRLVRVWRAVGRYKLRSSVMRLPLALSPQITSPLPFTVEGFAAGQVLPVQFELTRMSRSIRLAVSLNRSDVISVLVPAIYVRSSKLVLCIFNISMSLLLHISCHNPPLSHNVIFHSRFAAYFTLPRPGLSGSPAPQLVPPHCHDALSQHRDHAPGRPQARPLARDHDLRRRGCGAGRLRHARRCKRV